MKKQKEDEDDLYASCYFSCDTDIQSNDKRLMLHLENQSKLIEEGLRKFKANTKAYTQDFGPTKRHVWSRQEANFVFPGPWKEDQCFYIGLNSGEAFRVDTETDVLTEGQVHQHWDLVEEADRKEIKQVVDCGIWRSKLASACNVNPIDAIWVRKWKRVPDGTLRIKSRLCARRFSGCSG